MIVYVPEHVLLDTYTPEAYKTMEIDHVIHLFKAEHKIDLIISYTPSTFSPIFPIPPQYHDKLCFHQYILFCIPIPQASILGFCQPSSQLS